MVQGLNFSNSQPSINLINTHATYQPQYQPQNIPIRPHNSPPPAQTQTQARIDAETARLQAEEARKQNKNCDQIQYGYLDKKIENWEQSGDDQETVIKKIWEAIKERFMVTS